MCGIEPGEDGPKKTDQPSADGGGVMSGADEDGVDGIPVGAEQVVPSEVAAGLHVADRGFVGGSASASINAVRSCASLRSFSTFNPNTSLT